MTTTFIDYANNRYIVTFYNEFHYPYCRLTLSSKDYKFLKDSCFIGDDEEIVQYEDEYSDAARA